VCIEAVPQLVRLRCNACHAEERAAFRSAPRTPQLRAAHSAVPLRKMLRLLQLRFASQLRKINCTLQIAVAQKFARWAAMCHAGFAPKVPSTPPQIEKAV